MVDSSIPDRDASLGLIFRLNNLWSQVDYASLQGRYDDWNNILDALYRNLLFKGEMIVKVDEETKKVKEVEISSEDKKIYKYLSIQIAKAKKNFMQARSRIDKKKTRSRWYHSIQKKDVWTRKFMQKLKLYLKETEKRPGVSTYGTFGRKR